MTYIYNIYIYNVILEHIPLFLGFCFWCTLHHCSIVAIPFRLWPQSWVVWTLWQHHLQFIKSSSIPSISRFQRSETLSGRGFQFPKKDGYEQMFSLRDFGRRGILHQSSAGSFLLPRGAAAVDGAQRPKNWMGPKNGYDHILRVFFFERIC